MVEVMLGESNEGGSGVVVLWNVGGCWVNVFFALVVFGSLYVLYARMDDFSCRTSK